MTQIYFYHNIQDRLFAACRLIERAYQGGRRVLVLGAPTLLRELDLRLWSLNPTGFIPHVGLQSPLAMQTPVVLSQAMAPYLSQIQSQGDALLDNAVLINLSDSLPDEFERFAWVMELVGHDDSERLSARQRWRDYKAAGYPLHAKDYAQQGA